MNYYTKMALYYQQFNRSGNEVESNQQFLTVEQQTTYLVFETLLLLLFSTCMFCNSHSSSIKKWIIGTFLKVIQWCNKCKRNRIWDSQPYIGTIPACNILTSAAIFYTGALQSQALRIFKILNCCTINREYFFRHQRKFLQPTIESLWNQQQQALLLRFKEGNTPLAVAGDGRSDSLGHSAKYGSYTFIEMTCNKVVDFKLDQVNNEV